MSMSTPERTTSTPNNATRCRYYYLLTLLVAATWPLLAVAEPPPGKDVKPSLTPDTRFKPQWLASLTARGEPETYAGPDLRFIGMPVGGLCTGTLYLGGDGRLWLWDVFNRVAEGVVPQTVTYAGQRLGPRDGSTFVAPPQPQGPV